jgi:hypothetical protein
MQIGTSSTHIRNISGNFYPTFIFPPLAVAQDSFGVDGFLDFCSVKAVKYFICDEVWSGVLAGRFSAC